MAQLKREVSSKLKQIQIELDLGNDLQTSEDLLEQVEILNKILEDEGEFDQFLKSFVKAEENVDKELELNSWKKVQLEKLKGINASLLTKKQPTLENKNFDENVIFEPFLEEEDLPFFTGDCMDYFEWKRKWMSRISPYFQNPVLEIYQMKDNIPENAKNALYDVESVNEAWKILDKRYGNKKLICQKLRSKLKRLKPVNTEPKEILIEIYEEVKNLVNNIEEFGKSEVLKVDPVYLNVIYMNLHERHQMMWNQHKVDDC